MSRFTEDLVFARPGESPNTYGGLLNRLGLYKAPEHVERLVVNDWLKHNEPSLNLKYFLEAEGYDVEIPDDEEAKALADAEMNP